MKKKTIKKKVTQSGTGLPKGYLSPSQLEMYMRCPRQYMYRYIEGEKRPPGVALVEGSSHHEALHKNNAHKIAKGKDLQEKTVVEAFCDEFNDSSKEIDNWEGETVDSVIDRGKLLLNRYMTDFADLLKPKIAEHELTFPVAGVPFLGYVDVFGYLRGRQNTREKQAVIDYKVVARKKSEGELNNSVQLTYYGMALTHMSKVRTPTAGFCCLKKTKKPEVEWQPTLITPARVKWFKFVTTETVKAIQKGSFPPCDPTSWCCCERFCGFFDICKDKVCS